MREKLSSYWEAARPFERLRGSDGARRLITGFSAGTAAMLINRLATLGTTVVFARLLGPEGYGVYAFATAVMVVCLLVAEFGTPTFLVREIARAHAQQSWSAIKGLFAGACGILLKMSLLIAAIGGSVILLAGDRIGYDQHWTLLLIFALLPLTGLIRLVAAHLNGLRQLALAQLGEFTLVPGLALLGALGLLVTYSDDISPQSAVLLQIAATLIALLIASIWLFRARRPGADAPRERVDQIGLLRMGLPFLLLNVGNVLANQVDVIIVNAFVGNEATGLYRVAAQGALLSYSLMQVVTGVAAPYFARLHSGGDLRNLRRLFRITQLVGFGFAAATLGIYVLLGKQLIGWAFGDEFLPAYPYLIILTAGYAINHLFGPAGTLMLMCGHERITAQIMWATAALNVVACLFATHFAGAVGAAAVTASSLILYNALTYIFARKKLGI